MTRILFCHNAADRLQAAVTWLTQASRDADANDRYTIYAPDRQIAERLDHLLWTMPPTGFLPHCSARSRLAPETPILIATTASELGGNVQNAQTDRNSLLNLGDELPPEFERFTQLIEIISREENIRLPARERARYYRDQGHDIQYLDLQKAPL